MSKELNSAFQASIEIDTEAAQERLEKILHPQAGPTLTPAPQTQPASPTGRKKRSDAGVPKRTPADPDDVTLKVTLSAARDLAMLAAQGPNSLSAAIQDQIIAQLQRRLDQLQKGKG